MAAKQPDPQAAPTAPVRTDLQVSNTDEIVSTFESLYGMDNIRFDRAPSRWTLQSVETGRTSLARIEIVGSTRLHSAPVEGLFVIHLERGACQPVLSDHDRTFTEGQVFGLPPGRPWVAVTPGMLENALFLPLDRLEAIAVDIGAPLLPHLGKQVSIADPIKFAPMATLWTEITTVPTRSDLYSSPLVLDSAYRSLIVSVLHASNALGEQPAPRGSSKTVRQAVELMHARIGEPVTLTDLAQDLHVSERTLQAAFRSAFDVSPMRYLRRLRLEAVHQELRRAEPGQVRIEEVARRFGFGHLGRFAGEYHRTIGEYPHDTLKG